LESLAKWLDKARSGKVRPYTRSGGLVVRTNVIQSSDRALLTVHAQNNVPGTVYTLTTENLGPVSKDWTKDVLVFFYGPKCPYSKYSPPFVIRVSCCRPDWANREFFEVEMPKLLSMVDHVSSLVIAKIDCDGEFISSLKWTYVEHSLILLSSERLSRWRGLRIPHNWPVQRLQEGRCQVRCANWLLGRARG
jgi:hypothetical protein